ncbi:MAG: CHRD domain-containing protein [Nanoarchaeota archaeon]|nr:MAG: CHRD domain-containing protein [Nanoarchaeota archaeon]
MSNNITLTQNNPAPSTTNQRETSFAADLNGKQETPATPSTATGYVTATLNGNTLTLTGNFEGLISDATASHIHYGGVSYPGPAVFSITINEMAANSSSSSNETVGGPQQFSTNGTLSFTGTLTDSQIIQLTNGFFYVNVHSTQFPNGEIRGQLLPEGTPGISTSMATTQNSSATVTSNGTMGTSTGSTSTTTGSGGTTSGTGSSGGSY